MAIDVKGALTRKIGPLPAWGWAVAIGGGIIVFRMFRGGGSGQGSPFAFAPEGSTSNGGSGGGGGFLDQPISLPEFFSPTPSENGSTIDSSIGTAPLPVPVIANPSLPTLPSFGFSGITFAPIASAAITPPSNAAPSRPVGEAVQSMSSAQARTATMQVQDVAKSVATPTATAVAQLATRSGLDAAEAAALVRRQATAAVTTAARAVPLRGQTSSIVSKPKTTTSAPKAVPTTRKAPTAVTPLVRSIAGPRLRGGTRL